VWSPRELVRLVMAADRSELEEWVKGTAAAPLASESNDRMLASTRSVASTYIKPWEYLPEDGEFSVREWVQEVGRGASSQWLFLTMRDDQRALLRNLVATYLDLAILEGLSLTENPNRRLWYVLDELDTLGKVGTLRDGLTKLRKYGGSIITGIQSIAQLQSTYGDKGASVLAANLNTKLLLRAGDSDTAKWCEDTIGQQEIERRERSTNEGTSVNSGGMMGSMGQSEGQGYAERRVTQSAVLASEFMSLPDLSGYVGTPSEPWRRVDVPYMQLPDVVPAFMEAP
jgi:type IV secretory pathway TraG/TraD family ATPase VirD4